MNVAKLNIVIFFFITSDFFQCLNTVELKVFMCVTNLHFNMQYIEDIYFFEVNTKYISSSEVKKSVFFTSA